MSSLITLWFVILGTDVGNPYKIVIPSDEYVLELKNAIKKLNVPALDNIFAGALACYKLLDPLPEELLVQTLGGIDDGEKIGHAERVLATKLISYYFQDPAEGMVHLVVQAPLPGLPVSASNSSMNDEIAGLERQAIRSSWEVAYEGDAHLRLNDVIQDMQTVVPQQIYSNMMTIIQSSGTGKSRMVDKLAQIVFTLPFNIRNPSDSKQGAFPDSDSQVHDIFSVDPIGNTKDEAAGRFHAFFSTLFDLVRAALAEYKPPGSSLPEWWYCYLLDSSSVTPEENQQYTNNRQKLYGEAIRRHQAILAELQLEFKGSSLDIYREAKKLAIRSALELHEAIKSIGGIRRIIMYFDESHTLFDHPLRDEASRYAALCRALDDISRTKIFSLFLSTNSNLSRYAPPQAHVFSSRLSGANGLQAPFTELPFDCHPEFPMSQGQYTLESSGNLGFLSRFGRPLFWTRYQSGVEDTDKIVVALAKSKLAPGIDTNYIKDRGRDRELAELAVLDIRLLLGFESNTRGMKTQEEMVAGRMRIAHSVPKHREYMRSSYPSEPILAEAAASIWARFQQDKSHPDVVIPEMLQEHLMTGVVGKGERGELVTRLILTLAYDAAVRRCGPGLHTRAVPLTMFLEELFGKANYAIIANSKPDVGDVKFCDAFKDAQVRFTHFVRAGDDSAVSTEAAYAAILRSMAFQCFHSQRAIDSMVPIALKDKALTESDMSMLVVSTKDRVVAGSKASFSDINASGLKIFPNDQKLFGDTGCGRPYISLVMELGIPTVETHGGVEPPSKKHKTGRAPVEVVQPPAVVHHPATLGSGKNPHYRIFANGCTPSVYKVVTNQDVFASLLSSRTLLGEHPRQSAACLRAVKKQKPFWFQGTEFYGWLKDVGTLHSAPQSLPDSV